MGKKFWKRFTKRRMLAGLLALVLAMSGVWPMTLLAADELEGEAESVEEAGSRDVGTSVEGGVEEEETEYSVSVGEDVGSYEEELPQEEVDSSNPYSEAGSNEDLSGGGFGEESLPSEKSDSAIEGEGTEVASESEEVESQSGTEEDGIVEKSEEIVKENADMLDADWSFEDYTYTWLSGSEAAITGYTGTGGNITIPGTIGKYTVTRIWDNAFKGKSEITGVTLPESIEIIGYYAFTGTGIESINIPKNVTKCRDWNYNGPFTGATALKEVTFEVGMKAIPSCVLSGASNVTKVTIPDGVNSIGYCAFLRCSALTEVVLPENLESIDFGAFEGAGITSVVIPKNVLNCEGKDNRGPFASSMVKEVVFEEGIKMIPANVLHSANRVTKVLIPNGVTAIGTDAFNNCSALTEVVLPESLESIGKSAFSGTGITSVTIPKSVTICGGGDGFGPFTRAQALKEVVLEAGMKTIPANMLSCWGYQSYVEQVTIPDTVEEIGDGAFYCCNHLSDIYYAGSESDWKSIIIQSNNEPLSSATIHYNSAPSTSNHRYQLFDTGLTWEDAKKYCESVGGHLATITSISEQEEVDNLLGTGTRNSYWIGGYRESNTWKWITGEDMSYTNWASGEPNNYKASSDEGEDSLMLYRNKNPLGPSWLGAWNDLYHDGTSGDEEFFGLDNFGFICEWKSAEQESTCLVDISPTSFTCDGKEKKPAVTVRKIVNGHAIVDGNTNVLQEGVDYTVSYENNVDVGTAKVIVEGKGEYNGKVVKYFTIKEAPESGGTGEQGNNGNVKTLADFSIGKPKSGNITNETVVKFFPGDWSVSTADFPVQMKMDVNGDGSYNIRLSIGIGRKDLLDDETSWFDYKKKIKDIKKNIEEAKDVRDLKYYYENWAKQDFWGNKKNNVIKKSLVKTSKFQVFPELSCMGYGELKCDKDGNILSQEVKVATTANWEGSVDWKFFTPIGPMYLELKGGARVKGTIGPKYQVKEDKWEIVDGSLTLEPNISLEGGYGIAKVATMGAYGQASVPITLLPKSKGEFNAEAGVHLYAVFIIDWNYSLAKISVPLWGDSEQGDSLNEEAAALYAPEGYEWKLDDEEYIDTSFVEETTEWEGGADALLSDGNAGTGQSTLQEGILPTSLPMMTKIGNKKLLVWQAFDKEKNMLDACSLMYSVFEDGKWSEPAAVYDDGTSDFYADLKTINGNAVLVWQNADQAFGTEENTTTALEKMGAHSKIYAATFNASSNKFENIQNVSGDRTGMMPQVFEDGSKTVVTYVRNSDNAMMQTSGTNSILLRTMESGSLSDETTLLSTSQTVDNYTYRNGEVYYVAGDPSGDTQGTLLRNQKGQVVSSADGQAENVSYLANAGGQVVYLENGQVFSCESGSSSSLAGKALVGNGAKFCTNGTKSGIVWPSYDEETNTGSILASMLGEEGYAEAVTLYEAKGTSFRCISPVLDEDGRWQIAANAEDTQSGLHSLVYLEREEATDMSLDYATINEFDIDENGNIGVIYYVTNTSDRDIDTVILEAKKPGGDVITRKEISMKLAPGESGSGTEYVNFGALSGASDMQVSIYAKGQTDISENVITDKVGQTDISVASNYAEDDKSVYVVANLSNLSQFDADDIELSVAEEDKTLTKVDNISMNAGAEKEVECSVSKSDIAYNEDGIAYLKLVATAPSGDYNEDNNIAYVTLYNDSYTEPKDPDPVDPIPEGPVVPVSDVTLSPSALSLKVESVGTLTATVLPENATDKTVTWKSSDEGVATVKDGTVTGVGEGTADITVTTADGAKTATAKVTVERKDEQGTDTKAYCTLTSTAGTGGTIRPSGEKKVAKGGSQSYVIKADTGYKISDVLVDGKSVGTRNTYSFIKPDADHAIEARFAAEGGESIVKAQKITMSKSQLNLEVGEKASVSATVSPENASNKTLVWTTSKAGVAAVKNGTISAVSAGEATIKANAADGSGVFGSVKVAVNPAQKKAQAITGTKSYKKNRTDKAFSLDAKLSTGNGKLAYQTSNGSVATVSSKGVVTIKGVGKANITVKAQATAEYKEASFVASLAVVPGATDKVSAENLASGVKVSWKKVEGAAGYYIYRNGSKAKTVSKGSETSWTDSKAKSNGAKYTYKVAAFASSGASALSKSAAVYRLDQGSLSSAKNSAKGKMTAKWKKNAKAAGYELQYSTSKGFKSGTKTASIGSQKTTSKTVSGLKKKTYYVRVRAYKKAGSAKYYGAWSGVKTLKIKK